MSVIRSDTRTIATSEDVVHVRRIAREWAISGGFGLVDQTKIVTAASELGRNTLTYGGGGSLRIELLDVGGRRGLRLTFLDQGPGIDNIELALRDGFTTGSGLGLGLGGAKRLVDDFEIESKPHEGTRVTITRWK